MNQFLTSAFALAVLGAVGCGGGTSGGDGGNPDSGSGPDVTCSATPAAVTMTDLQTSMVMPSCLSCHYPAMGTTPEGLGGAYGDYTTAMKTYEMVGKKSVYAGAAGTLLIVDPNKNLANSTLWLKISSPTANGFPGPHGEDTLTRMPQSAAPLSETVQQQVKDWICDGAPM